MEEARKMNVAIDGPAGAGKSTVARLVANQLGYVYIDSGAMYRVVALKCLNEGLQASDVNHLTRLTETMQIELTPGPTKQQVWLDGVNVTEEIRSPEVTAIVAQVAAIPTVRKLLVDRQKNIAARKGVVMDGRDIGTHVLPDAEVKVFLTATAEKRAERRFHDLPSGSTTMEQLIKDIDKRDRMDKNRSTSPLIIAEDATVIDTTNMTIEAVVEQIMQLCRTI